MQRASRVAHVPLLVTYSLLLTTQGGHPNQAYRATTQAARRQHQPVPRGQDLALPAGTRLPLTLPLTLALPPTLALTLRFLQNFDIIETLDAIREEKILEYVIVLQVSE